MHQDFHGFAKDATVWVDELPDWSELSPVGHVTGYWRWPSQPPSPAVRRVAAWGYRAGFGGHGEYGVLGGRFEPHEHPYLRVSVAATLGVGSPARGLFARAKVGLPLEYVGGVLAGALQEPDTIGPGTLTFDHAAVHEVDSSWEVFRLLAIGVVRLLGLPPAAAMPDDTLPRFGGSIPASRGAS